MDVVILTIVTPLSSTRLAPEIVPDVEFGSTVNVNDYECEGYHNMGFSKIICGFKIVFYTS